MSGIETACQSFPTLCGLLYLTAKPIPGWTASIEGQGYEMEKVFDLMGSHEGLKSLQRFRLSASMTAYPQDYQTLKSMLATEEDKEEVYIQLLSSPDFANNIFIHPNVLQESSLYTLPKIQESIQYLLTYFPGYEDYWLNLVKTEGFIKADKLLGLPKDTSITMMMSNRAYTDDYLSTVKAVSARSETYYSAEPFIKRLEFQKTFREKAEQGLSRTEVSTDMKKLKSWTDSTVDVKLPVWYRGMHRAGQALCADSHFGGDDATWQSRKYKEKLENKLKAIEEDNLRRGLPLEPEIEKLWADRHQQSDGGSASTASDPMAPSGTSGPKWQLPQNTAYTSLLPEVDASRVDMEAVDLDELLYTYGLVPEGTGVEPSGPSAYPEAPDAPLNADMNLEEYVPLGPGPAFDPRYWGLQ